MVLIKDLSLYCQHNIWEKPSQDTAELGQSIFFITESPREKEKELRVDSMRIRHVRLWCFLKNTAKFNFEVIIVSRRASERDQYFAWSYYLQVMTNCPL